MNGDGGKQQVYGGDTTGHAERLRALETWKDDWVAHHGATKNDVTKLKVWALGGVIGAIPTAAVIAAAIATLFGGRCTQVMADQTRGSCPQRSN